MSDRVGVRELRNQVAAVLRRAAAGERIVVTADGEPVAQLGPLEPPGPPDIDDLIAAGLVDPPAVGGGVAPCEPVDVAVDVRIDELVAEVRGR